MAQEGAAPGHQTAPLSKVRRKHTRRLADGELVRRLEASGLLEQSVLDALLDNCSEDGTLSEAIVESGLMGDWELGRWASRWFGRPFLPLESCSPDPEASEGLDVMTLIRHRLVPLWRYGGGLVVAMPGITSEAALRALAEDAGCAVHAVVGSVRGNRRWLEDHLPRAPLPEGEPEGGETWSLLFDVGDVRAREAFGEDVGG